MPIAPALQRFVDSMLAGSGALIDATARDVQSMLREQAGGMDSSERAIRAELATRLGRHAPSHRTSFLESLAERVRAELAQTDDGIDVPPPSGLGGLTLMDESRVEIDIEISRATELIDTAAEWELRELQTFTSTLIGQAHVSAESNPLRPMHYAAALWDAACVVHPGQAHRAVLLRLSAIACAPLLKRAWAGASTRLESEGVTPGVYRSRVLPRSIGPAPADTPAGATSSVLRTLLAAMPGGAAVQRPAVVASMPPRSAPPATGDAEAALAQVDTILKSLPPKTLSKLQAAAVSARLDAHRAAALDAQVSQPDGRPVAELLARLFDAVLADPELHPACVPVVARLQVPALRFASRDPSALLSTRHPMWQLLDRIGQASASYPQPADSRGAGVLTLCTRLVDELVRQHGATADLVRKALDKLDGFLAAQLQAQCKVAGAQVERLREAERRETLQHGVAQRLAEQMEVLRPGPVVKRFLSGTWARVIATALMRQGEDDEPARSYIRAVDDLLWTVQSPDHPASRQRLAALLPPMLQCLRDGMASIALPEAEQQAILDELLAIHTAALRRGEGVDATTTTLSGDALSPTRSAAPPARSAPPTTREPMIDIASLETVPADLMPATADAPPGDAPARHVAALRPGDRARMFVNGRWARVQLLWRSDRGEFMLFAGEAVGDTHSITRRALEKLAAAGLLRPIEDQPLSQRAFETVERRLVAARRFGAD